MQQQKWPESRHWLSVQHEHGAEMQGTVHAWLNSCCTERAHQRLSKTSRFDRARWKSQQYTTRLPCSVSNSIDRFTENDLIFQVISTQSTDLPIWVPLGWHATWSQSYSKKRVFWIFMYARILSVAVFLLSYCSLGYQNTSWHTCAFSIQRVFRASAWTVCTRSTSRICLQVADQKTPWGVFCASPAAPPWIDWKPRLNMYPDTR